MQSYPLRALDRRLQEAKESIDEEDPRPTSSNGAYITWAKYEPTYLCTY